MIKLNRAFALMLVGLPLLNPAMYPIAFRVASGYFVASITSTSRYTPWIL